MFPTDVVLAAAIGGIVPPLLWLYVLLREDDRCPEPRRLILLAFIAGMLAVPFAVPLEQLARTFLPEQFSTILAWATIEETLKYLLAAIVILWRPSVDESVDLVIYMLTVALGFAALENALFFAQSLTTYGYFGAQGAIATDNLRFVGSTLLHIIASSALGFAMGFSFRKARGIRALYAASGLILAIALHTAFNFLIIHDSGSYTLLAFFIVWSGAVAFFAIFEILKYFRYRSLPKNTC